MSQKQLIALFSVLMVAIVVAWQTQQGTTRQVEVESGGLLLPEFRRQIAQLQAIEIAQVQGAETHRLVMEVVGDDWLLKERGYPVNRRKLVDLLEQLASAEKLEAKTAKAENYVKLGVAELDPVLPDNGTRLSFYNAEGAPYLRLYIGHEAAQRGNNYARIAGDSQSWLLSEHFTLSTQAADWLQQPIVDLPAASWQSIRYERDGDALELRRNNVSEPLQIVDLPADRQLRYEELTSIAAEALSRLQMEDVKSNALEPEVVLARTVFQSFAGLTVEVELLSEEPGTIRLITAYQEDKPEAQQQADELSQLWEDRQFQIDSRDVARVFRQWDDFTELKTPATAEP